MDACQLFLIRYGRTHDAMVDELVAKVTDAQARASPVPGLNTIAWLLWHVARAEDCVINRLVANRTQVFFEQDWASRLNVPRLDFGVGMTAEEVADLSARINLDEAKAYWKSVEMRTRVIVDALSPENLDEVNDPDYIRQIIEKDGMMGDVTPETLAFWPGLPDRSKGYFLISYGLFHNWTHYNDGLINRGLYGIRGRF